MNDTNATADTTLRYDSGVDATSAPADERHTIQTYLSDALALERHIAVPLQRQLDLDDTTDFAEAVQVFSTIKSLTESHIAQLESQLADYGGEGGSAIKSAWSQLLGAGAAVVGGSRKTKVSKSLRDDYTALALATAGYTMLCATALGLGDGAPAHLAKKHLEDYAPVMVQIFKVLPGAVLRELALDGANVDITAEQYADQMTSNAWH